MNIIISKRVRINKAKTGHGTECGRIQIQATELHDLIGKEVFIVVKEEEDGTGRL